ncbi:MAG TPA: PIN domain-containing protein [Solirubrobacterales bacterium]
MSGALLDTSVVIAGEETLDLPEKTAISVVTIGELRAGILLAKTSAARGSRQARLVAIRDAFEPLPIDEAVAESYGEVLATARAERRITTATDLLIIATAAATGRSLHTLDRRQAKLAGELGVATSPG